MKDTPGSNDVHVETKPQSVGVVGAGVMGRGIAQMAALAGCEVWVFDTRPGASHAALLEVEKGLSRLVEKGKLSSQEASATRERLRVADSLCAFADFALLGRKGCIVEAIVENLEAKMALFQSLETMVGPECLLATNTSSLPVSAIAAGCAHPERVAGFHFFNPVPLMKVVEVVPGVRTASWVCDSLTALAKAMGHHPVRAKDTPGFVVNHAGRGLGTEALRIVGEGVSTFEDVDAILRDGVGFRMGPFELLDLTGLDVSHPVMESIYHQFYEEPRFRPSPITAQRLVAGLLGRKSGEGFYRYEKGVKLVQAHHGAVASPSHLLSGQRVWVSARWPSHFQDLVAPWVSALKTFVENTGAVWESSAAPSESALCFVFPFGTDATSECVTQGLDAHRVVAVDAFVHPRRHRTLMKTPVTNPECVGMARALLAFDGVGVSVISDCAGLVAQRVLATVVNIGSDIAQQRIATPLDVDLAVTLGLGYPHGPLAWGDALGARRVLEVLDALLEHTGDPRYRASPWLKRRALLGVSLCTPES